MFRPRHHAPYRRLQQYAIAISIISVLYNGAEGGLSIGFGAESKSRSLIFFGIQSGIEVISSLLVVWRFRNIAKPGEERGTDLNAKELRFEKLATFAIGLLLIALAIGTVASSIAILALHQEPDASNASLIISASALVIMVFIWLPKRYLATALDSSTMRGEAICSLSCVQLTSVLFVGSLIFRLWRGGWWLDGATSMILSILFGWEGYKMIRWARDPEFTGGCCEDCRVKPESKPPGKDAELGITIEEKCGCCADSKKGSCGDLDEDDVLGVKVKNPGSESPVEADSHEKETPAALNMAQAAENVNVQIPQEGNYQVSKTKDADERAPSPCCSDCE